MATTPKKRDQEVNRKLRAQRKAEKRKQRRALQRERIEFVAENGEIVGDSGARRRGAGTPGNESALRPTTQGGLRKLTLSLL